MIMKSWTAEMDMEKEDVKSIFIWIQFKLNFKYRGEKTPFKIVSQLENPIKRVDVTTLHVEISFNFLE